MVALGAVDCGSTGGAAQPSPDVGKRSSAEPRNQSPNAGSPPSPTGMSGAMSQIDPCNLISQQEGARWGITGARENNGSAARSCQYTQANNGNVAVSLRETQGIDSVSTQYGSFTDTTVGGRKAKEQRSQFGSCLIAIAISPTSRVDVLYTDPSADAAKSCQEDEQVAQLVSGKITGN